MGFGDSPEGSHSRPSLTTFALSSDRVAAEAIHLILQHRRSPSPPSVLLLPEELIPRASTGPAPAPSPTRPPPSLSLLPAQPLPPESHLRTRAPQHPFFRLPDSRPKAESAQ